MTDASTIPVGYQVRDFIDADRLREDLAFSDANLSDAMMRQAALFSHYGVLAAQASRQVDVVKLLLENTEAAIYNMLRGRAAAQGEKTTEVQLEKAVSRADRVVAMKKALIEAKQVEANAKTAMEAFRHKRDMLVQVGLISREELKGDLRMSAAQDAARIRAEAYEMQKEKMHNIAAGMT